MSWAQEKLIPVDLNSVASLFEKNSRGCHKSGYQFYLTYFFKMKNPKAKINAETHLSIMTKVLCKNSATEKHFPKMTTTIKLYT